MKDRILLALGAVDRPGIPELLTYLRYDLHAGAGFFTAPASTEYHLSRPGGLAEHSWNVYEQLSLLVERHKIDVPADTVTICGLLHDVCKVNFYKPGFKNVKDDATGQWSKKPIYIVEDAEPLGHGEKSVIIVRRFIKLTIEEELAIRWHMGPWDAEGHAQRRQLGQALDMHPLVAALQIADFTATRLVE